MKLHNLKPTEGSRHTKKRLGRGIGSGLGKTSGKGHKGQNARSGGGTRPGFEGGQTPLYRRIPKRGFSNSLFKVNYAEVNLDTLNKYDEGTTITPELLLEDKVVKQLPKGGIKVLGKGEITKKLNVKANKFSASAKEAIENKGGKVTEIKK